MYYPVLVCNDRNWICHKGILKVCENALMPVLFQIWQTLYIFKISYSKIGILSITYPKVTQSYVFKFILNTWAFQLSHREFYITCTSVLTLFEKLNVEGRAKAGRWCAFAELS